jgi:small-conductance mechanosensitive channel
MLKLLFRKRITTTLRFLFLCSAIFSSMLFQAPLTQGQEQTSGPQAAATAPVIVNGRELFRVGGVTSYTAQTRASVITARIKALAADKSIDPKSLHSVKEGDITYIKAGNHVAMGLVEADAIREGVTLEVLELTIRAKIAEAIVEYRNDRTPRTILSNSGYALLATVITALLLWGILRIFIWLDTLAQRRIKARIERLETKSHYIFDADQIMDMMSSLLKTAKVLCMLVAIYFYLNLVLGLYPWTRYFAQQLFTFTIDPLRIIGRGLVSALPDIFFLVILFFITRYILKITRLFFAGIDRGSIHLSGFEREWGLPTYKIVRLLIISFAMIVAYPYIPGSSSDAFKGVSIFLGVIFSLGSSSVLTNIIAGYTITYRRAFKIGDRIKIDDHIGEVVDRSVLVTRLRSLKNEEIVIPNSTILNSNITNYSTEAKTNGLILHTTVGIGYEVPWRQVEAMLLLAAERTKGIRGEPKPFILQQALGDFAITYELNVYIDDAREMMKLYSALHRNILDVFNEYNVQIMTPNYEQDTPQPKTVPKDQWYAPPAKSEG